MTNSLGHKTIYYWNEMGLVTKTIDPLGGTSETLLTEFGETAKEIDPLNRVTSYEYDERGNQTGVKNPDGSELSFKFEEDKLVQMTDEIGGQWTWEYDHKNRLTKRTDPLKRETLYWVCLLPCLMSGASCLVG